MLISTEYVVIPVMLGETVKVNVAGRIWLARIDAFSRSQVSVM